MQDMIDLHCHILPGIDDGSKNIEETRALLASQKEQGVSIVAATPHFYADEDTPERFTARRAAALELALPAAEELGMEIRPGAEVHFFTNVSNLDLEPFLIEGTDLLLLEMPFGKWSGSMIEEVIALQQRCQVVLAHIERYWHWQPLISSVWNRLADAGVLFQINCNSLIHKETSRKVLKLIKKGRIAFIASDAHNLETRPVRFEEALGIVENKLGTDMLETQLKDSQLIFNSHSHRTNSRQQR